MCFAPPEPEQTDEKVNKLKLAASGVKEQQIYVAVIYAGMYGCVFAKPETD